MIFVFRHGIAMHAYFAISGSAFTLIERALKRPAVHLPLRAIVDFAGDTVLDCRFSLAGFRGRCAQGANKFIMMRIRYHA